jgi:hypothetical protein
LGFTEIKVTQSVFEATNHKIGSFQNLEGTIQSFQIVEDPVKWSLISDKSEVSERKSNSTY